MSNMTAAERHFHRDALPDYLGFLEDLHFLIAAGRGDGVTARFIREYMNEVGGWLTPEEVHQVKHKSAVLAQSYAPNLDQSMNETPDSPAAERVDAWERIAELIEALIEAERAADYTVGGVRYCQCARDYRRRGHWRDCPFSLLRDENGHLLEGEEIAR